MLKNVLERKNIFGFDESKPKEVKHQLMNFM